MHVLCRHGDKTSSAGIATSFISAVSAGVKLALGPDKPTIQTSRASPPIAFLKSCGCREGGICHPRLTVDRTHRFQTDAVCATTTKHESPPPHTHTKADPPNATILLIVHDGSYCP